MTRRTSYVKILATTLLAAITCALLSTPGLAAWADNLPDSAAARWASTAAHALDDTLTKLGANKPAAFIQSITRAAEARKFTRSDND